MNATEDSLFGTSARFRRRRQLDRWLGRLVPLSFLLVILPLLDLVYWIATRALPTFSWTTLTTNPEGTSGGLYGPIVGSAGILAISTAIAAAIGIAGAIYTAEFASERAAATARFTTNLLAGVPSIVVGYFGYFALVLYFGWGASLLAGSVTLSIFILPYVFRSADLAFASVPPELREASLGMGSTRGQYIRRVAFPVALPQVLNGVFLAMAIGLGETAPLLYTAFWNNFPPTGLNQPVGYLTGLIWNYYDEPLTFGTEVTMAFQAAFILMVAVIVLNIAIRIIGGIYARRLRGLYH